MSDSSDSSSEVRRRTEKKNRKKEKQRLRDKRRRLEDEEEEIEEEDLRTVKEKKKRKSDDRDDPETETKPSKKQKTAETGKEREGKDQIEEKEKKHKRKVDRKEKEDKEKIPSSTTHHAVHKYPVGVSDYRKLVEDGYFYWDRTLFIKEFFESDATLILRPRRWGKTITMSMAKYFFDASQRDLARQLFAKSRLAVEQPEFFEANCGQYPVIFVSFAECTAATWEKMQSMLVSIISSVYQQHLYLIDDRDFLRDFEKRKFLSITNEEKALYEFALKELTALLHRCHKKRVIVVIDEYEKPLNTAFQNGFLDKAVAFLSSAFTGCMKDNSHLEKGLLTGILCVAKYGYLSGLNNLDVYSFLSTKYNDTYGLTKQEVKQALINEGMFDQFDAVKVFYNGYAMAGSNRLLFNPWSVINCLHRKSIEPYWVLAGGTDAYIVDALWRSGEGSRKSFLALLGGDSAVVPFTDDITYEYLGSAESLWSVLYHSGYITGQFVANSHRKFLEARAPNTEVVEELARVWRNYFQRGSMGPAYDGALSSLFSGEGRNFEVELKKLALEVFSIHDTAKMPELWYHAFVLSMIYPSKLQGYIVESNIEAGSGRVDILLYYATDKSKHAIILEFKTVTDANELKKITEDSKLSKLASLAVKQIEEKSYVSRLKGKAMNAYLFGVAVVKKFVFVISKDVAL